MQGIGLWLRDHRRAIAAVQWTMIGVYAVLLVGPSLLPVPGHSERLWSNAVLVAQFVFWGLWWPGVILSVVLFGRLWCGLFCPEGALTEFASRHGRGKAIPGWMRWPGWPFAAFALTTVYGQMVSVYQYADAALLVLGGSTAAAVAVGYVYGKEKRVWCRYLCPVGGVFGLLAKLSPVHFRVDPKLWNGPHGPEARHDPVNCAPLVPIRTMESSSPCHMCGRCAGQKGAIALAGRRPGSEIVSVGGRTAGRWDSVLVLVGMMGIATGAFLWSSSPWLAAAKQWVASRLLDAGVEWPLTSVLPWWILTNAPEAGDVMTVLDGALMLAFVAAATATMSAGLAGPVALAAMTAGSGRRGFDHLVQCLLPLAGCGLFLGLSATSVSLLRTELPWLPQFADHARMLLLAAAATWSLWLSWQVLGLACRGRRRVLATACQGIAVAVALLPWWLLFSAW